METYIHKHIFFFISGAFFLKPICNLEAKPWSSVVIAIQRGADRLGERLGGVEIAGQAAGALKANSQSCRGGGNLFRLASAVIPYLADVVEHIGHEYSLMNDRHALIAHLQRP